MRRLQGLAGERGMFGGLPHGLEAPDTDHADGPLQVSKVPKDTGLRPVLLVSPNSKPVPCTLAGHLPLFRQSKSWSCVQHKSTMSLHPHPCAS